ncbi:TRAP transporter small permease [Larsenimonas rhizosphaerae]|uniref:TRAP transporter small permease protein n=1 Tax=Larsenimonas rhizosphaerae TaxID=2944682 RepID=A0AA42CTH7_9GAMM|nr:TRAP transporter small permease [Larsenimonas rhizosphaerae]MCM2130366.1 TRAP transporter small permease [Larsenimonas rhizosphaerae]MCX2523071.1 TRAP transporter small permease [Larsenimonas rhizosphaerae]
MRFYLMPLYRGGAWLAGLAMMAITLLIMLQVLGRVLDRILVLFGYDALGLSISGMSEIAGFLLVGATFLGTAYTFTKGGHIRVTLLTDRIPVRPRALLEVIMLTIALALTLVLGWQLAALVLDSHAYDEVSYGMAAVPLMYPQAVLLTGIALLTLALLEAWISTLVLAISNPSRLFPATDPSPRHGD